MSLAEKCLRCGVNNADECFTVCTPCWDVEHPREPVVDPRDARIAALESELKEATQKSDAWQESADRQFARAEAMRADRDMRKACHAAEIAALAAATERAEAAEQRAGELREAMREILVGKIAEDNRHPMGEWFSMASRFMYIAKSALARTKPGST